MTTDDVVIGSRSYYKDGGEWRMRAQEGSVYDPYVDESANLLDEIKSLRADMKELVEIAQNFVDEGKCWLSSSINKYGRCACKECEWNSTEHRFELFCMQRGL